MRVSEAAMPPSADKGVVCYILHGMSVSPSNMLDATGLSSEFQLAKGGAFSQAIVISLLALVSYEYAVTCADEIELFWRSTTTGTTVLFLYNRYTILLSCFFRALYPLLPFQPPDNRGSDGLAEASPTCSTPTACNLSSCTSPVVRAGMVFSILEPLSWTAFSAMCVFALRKGDRRVPGLILFFSLPPVIIYMTVFILNASGYYDPRYGCLDRNVPFQLYQTWGLPLFIAVATGSQIVADLIFLAVIWISLQRRFIFNKQKIRSLTNTFLQSGELYYFGCSTLILLNVLHLVFFIAYVNRPSDATAYEPMFTTPLTSVLISRFLIELQSVHKYPLGDEPGGLTRSLGYARGVGSLHTLGRASPIVFESNSA
ncbi:hypothetical protein C8Q76DRAFT_715505 [Earliella scabrosa]|nr:hypothetical protein C8Q76DRAFT_715505 [Earliella scabrosa]